MVRFKGGIVALGWIVALAVAEADEGLAEKQRELIERIERTPGGSGLYESGVSNHYSSDVLALGAGAGPVVPALCKAVSEYRSREAFETLDALGPHTYAHFPLFVKAFVEMRGASTWGKGSYNVGIHSSKLVREDLTPLQLAAFVEHPDVDVRSVALEALLQRFQGKELPEEYILLIRRRLVDDSPLVRDVAQRFVYGRPELELPLLPELTDAFRLARPEEPDAFQRFREEGSYHHVGRVSLSLAGAISRCGEEAIDEVLTFLDHPSDPHRVLAIDMLVQMATPKTTELILDRLDDLTKDPNRHVARTAIRSVAALGGRSQTKLLIEILEQGPGERAVAAASLGPLRDSAALEPLHRALEHSRDVSLRIAAAQSLEAMGPMASETLPTLREAFASEDEALRFAAASAVGAISDAPEEAIAMLDSFLVPAKNDKDRWGGRMQFYARIAGPALARLNELSIDDRARHEERLLEVLSNMELTKAHYLLNPVMKEGFAQYGAERTLVKLREAVRSSSTADQARKDFEKVIASIEARRRTESAQTASLEIASP